MESISFDMGGMPGCFSLESRSMRLGEEDYRFDLRWKEPPRRLYVIFSTRCNLRCPYCFQNGEGRVSGDANIEEVCSYVRQLQDGIDQVVLFGGEPFLSDNLALIEGLLDEFDYMRFMAFTNGNYSDAYRNLLDDYSYVFDNITLTLDGPREVHNRRRPNPIADSYGLVVDNARHLARHGIPFCIQINVDRRNIRHVGRLLSEIESDADLASCHVMLNPVKYSADSLAPDRLVEAYFELRESHDVDMALNSRLVANLKSLVEGGALTGPRCALGETAVLDIPSGSVYACPQNASSVIGHLDEGKVTIDKGGMTGRIRETRFEAKKCRECTYVPLCPYCCPYDEPGTDCRESVSTLLKQVFQHADALFADTPLVMEVGGGSRVH